MQMPTRQLWQAGLGIADAIQDIIHVIDRQTRLKAAYEQRIVRN